MKDIIKSFIVKIPNFELIPSMIEHAERLGYHEIGIQPLFEDILKFYLTKDQGSQNLGSFTTLCDSHYGSPIEITLEDFFKPVSENEYTWEKMQAQANPVHEPETGDVYSLLKGELCILTHDGRNHWFDINDEGDVLRGGRGSMSHREFKGKTYLGKVKDVFRVTPSATSKIRAAQRPF